MGYMDVDVKCLHNREGRVVFFCFFFGLPSFPLLSLSIKRACLFFATLSSQSLTGEEKIKIETARGEMVKRYEGGKGSQSGDDFVKKGARKDDDGKIRRSGEGKFGGEKGAGF